MKRKGAGGFSAGVEGLAGAESAERRGPGEQLSAFLRRDQRAGGRSGQNQHHRRFFAVPAQAFQTDFNDNYARYQQASEKQAMQGRQSLMAQLSGLQTLFLFARCCCSPSPLSSGSACPDG
jgi:hypothetical protein